MLSEMSQAASIDWPAFSALDRLVNRLRIEGCVWLHDDAVSRLAAMNVRSGVQNPGAVSPVSGPAPAIQPCAHAGRSAEASSFVTLADINVGGAPSTVMR